jgi:uncharacterized membrane protein HdeD (DUF308 family)
MEKFLLGIILLGSPLITVYILPFVFGLFAMIGGIILIVFAFRIRRLAKQAVT